MGQPLDILSSLVMLVPLSVHSMCPMGQWTVPLEFGGKLQGTDNIRSKTLQFINNIMSCLYTHIMHYIYTCTCFSLVNESLTCHPQCDSVTSCWGPSDTQCEECRNFRYLRRCVQDCSVVSLAANSRQGELGSCVLMNHMFPGISPSFYSIQDFAGVLPPVI